MLWKLGAHRIKGQLAAHLRIGDATPTSCELWGLTQCMGSAEAGQNKGGHPDRLRHGGPHRVPGRREEHGGEEPQEDLPLLHPLRHHQHVCIPPLALPCLSCISHCASGLSQRCTLNHKQQTLNPCHVLSQPSASLHTASPGHPPSLGRAHEGLPTPLCVMQPSPGKAAPGAWGMHGIVLHPSLSVWICVGPACEPQWLGRGGALVAIDLGWMGPNYSISTACATANYAFVAASNHIRKGDANIMIAGGSEAPIIPVGLGGFVACRCAGPCLAGPGVQRSVFRGGAGGCRGVWGFRGLWVPCCGVLSGAPFTSRMLACGAVDDCMQAPATCSLPWAGYTASKLLSLMVSGAGDAAQHLDKLLKRCPHCSNLCPDKHGRRSGKDHVATTPVLTSLQRAQLTRTL